MSRMIRSSRFGASLLAAFLASGCQDPLLLPALDSGVDTSTENVCPVIASVVATPEAIDVGEQVALTSEATDEDGAPTALAFTWTADSGGIGDATSKDTSFSCTGAGNATLTLRVTDGECEQMRTVAITCTEPVPVLPRIILNEIETSSGMPGDWAELYNTGDEPFDISGYRLRDNDDGHWYQIPNGTLIAGHGYYVLDEAVFGFGFGTMDSTRLFDATNKLVDSYTWTAHSMTTLGRCANGSGPFTVTVRSTKGTPNACEGDPDIGLTYTTWPGGNVAMTGDVAGALGGNISDVAYESTPTPALWAVQNNPQKLHRLIQNAGTWTQDPAGWSTGKLLHYANGMGSPDTEGLTLADEAGIVYVVAERENTVLETSKLSILRYDTSAAGTELTATHEWTLTADFPPVGGNGGIEGIAWASDTWLVAHLFFDEHTNLPYLPITYPNHGTGLFFVSLETMGIVHAYALDHMASTFTRVATIMTGQLGIMGLRFDEVSGYLWSYCDDACTNRSAVLAIDASPISQTFGRFVVKGAFERGSSLGNYGYEGIAFGTECTGGNKTMFFADDANTGDHAIRYDTIPCGAFLP